MPILYDTICRSHPYVIGHPDVYVTNPSILTNDNKNYKNAIDNAFFLIYWLKTNIESDGYFFARMPYKWRFLVDNNNIPIYDVIAFNNIDNCTLFKLTFGGKYYDFTNIN